MATPIAISVDPKGDWLADAREAIHYLAGESAKTGQTFTADDLRELVGRPDHDNWIGAAFSAASQHKVIVQAGFTKSRAKSRHGGVIRTWKAAA